MSAAELAQWLRDTAETVPDAGFVTCDRRHKPHERQQVTPQGHDFKRETDACDLVPAVTVFSERVGKQDTESRPQRSDPYAIGAPWRPLAAAYYRHHFACPSCCAAGHGRGDRCTAGADLWASYEAASDAAHDTNTNARRIRT